MNNEEKIAVIQAYIDKEIIEYRALLGPLSEWKEVEDEPTWNFGIWEYRKKEKI